MEDTSARFDPTVVATVEDHVMGLFHRFAYEVAAGVIEPGATVLDIGFGEGYGAEILRTAGARYVGVEVDPAAVAHARERYGGDFRLYDGSTLPVGPFDLVVSFQVIEHVPDVESWLAAVAQLTRRALFATPNRLRRLGEGERPWNRYHVQEFSPVELRELLTRHFGDVVVTGVVAPSDVEAVELARFARARNLARLDPLRLRYRLPPWLDARLRRRLRRPLQSGAAFQYSVADLRHSGEAAEQALVLLAHASHGGDSSAEHPSGQAKNVPSASAEQR